MTDYSTSKYGDAIAEIADEIIGNGFADETAGDVDSTGHYALVTLDAFSLANTTLPTDNILSGSRVIIRTDSQGFVDVHYGPAHPADPGAYAALMRAWNEITAEVNTDDE